MALGIRVRSLPLSRRPPHSRLLQTRVLRPLSQGGLILSCPSRLPHFCLVLQAQVSSTFSQGGLILSCPSRLPHCRLLQVRVSSTFFQGSPTPKSPSQPLTSLLNPTLLSRHLPHGHLLQTRISRLIYQGSCPSRPLHCRLLQAQVSSTFSQGNLTQEFPLTSPQPSISLPNPTSISHRVPYDRLLQTRISRLIYQGGPTPSCRCHLLRSMSLSNPTSISARYHC